MMMMMMIVMALGILFGLHPVRFAVLYIPFLHAFHHASSA
jgi:hypothetical protein